MYNIGDLEEVIDFLKLFEYSVERKRERMLIDR